MNFQEYVDTVKERIKEYLPEEYAGAEINVHQMRKLILLSACEKKIK